jgi:hypothetical protein
MRMRRMTTRRWMLAVALVALTLGGLLRWNACWRCARKYESQQWLYMSLAETIRGDGVSSSMSLSSGELAVRKGWALRRGLVVTNPSELEALAVGFEQASRERDKMRHRCLRAIYRLWEPVPAPPPSFTP